MKETLNLTIEKDVKERAKKLAKEKGISLSRMVEEALKSIAGPYDEWKPQKGSVVSKMSGSIPAPEAIEYDTLLAEALMEEKEYEKDND